MMLSPNTGKMKSWQIDLAALLVFCLASAGTYFAVLRPMSDRHANFAAQEWMLAHQRRRASRLRAASLAQSQRLASLREALADRKIELQPADSLNRQVAQMADLLAKCDLRTDDIHPGRISEAGRYNIVPITLAGKGGYKSCGSFFHKLSQNSRDTGVVSFEISGSPDQPGADGQFRFELRWYTAAEQADQQG